MVRRARQVQLIEYPVGEVTPGHFVTVEVDVPDPAPGQVLVRNTFTSVDPGMRLRLQESGPAGYFFAFLIAGSCYLLILAAVHLMMPRMTPLDENLRRAS